MRPFLIRILFLSLTFLLTVASCGRQYGAGARLADGLTAIDSLLQTDPDSAYTLLERYERSRLVTPRDSAMFRLLWAEGRDKTFRDDTVADEITRAVDFFRHIGDRRNLMRSLYYLGRIRQNAKSYGAAIIAFQEGLENADSTELLYRGKLHTAASETASAIDDWPRMEDESRKAWECYIRLDSLVFAREAQLWYAVGLSQNGKIDKGISLLQSLYSTAADQRDTTFKDITIGYLAKSYLWKNDFHKSRQYLSSLYSSHRNSLQLRELNLFLWTMIKDSAPADSLSIIASEIADEYGKDKVLHEYYAFIEDYFWAYKSLEREYLNLDNEYGKKSRNDAIFLIGQNQENRISNIKLELKLEKERNIWITISGILIVAILIMVFIYRIRSKDRKIKELLGTVSVFSKEYSDSPKPGMTENPLLRKIFKSLDDLYSQYYRTSEGERKGIIGKMGDIIERLRKDKKFLSELEMEINRCSNNILHDIYSGENKLTESQRRLVAYLYFGLSTETICELLQVAPDAYYSRKSRLLGRIKGFASPRRDELLRMISGPKC